MPCFHTVLYAQFTIALMFDLQTELETKKMVIYKSCLENWCYLRLVLIEGTTRSLSAKLLHNLEVMTSSSLDFIRPRRKASAMASPRGCSVRYAEAVSKCRYPALIASMIAAFVVSGVTGGLDEVPMPITGMVKPQELKLNPGTVAISLYFWSMYWIFTLNKLKHILFFIKNMVGVNLYYSAISHHAGKKN